MLQVLQVLLNISFRKKVLYMVKYSNKGSAREIKLAVIYRKTCNTCNMNNIRYLNL